MRRISAALALSIGVVSPAMVAGPGAGFAHAAVPTAAYQGMPISVEGTGQRCTIGYNDAENRRSFTAAHCGADGARVRLVDPADFTRRSGYVGTLRLSSEYVGMRGPNDWAVIEWDEGITIAPNNYSGDTLIHPDEIRPGDQICYHGSTTHKGNRESNCGEAVITFGHEAYAIGVSGQPGDSGGPVFIPGRGLVGVVSGHVTPTLNLPGFQGVKARFLRATFPQDGPADAVSQFHRWAVTEYLRDQSNLGVVPLLRTIDRASTGQSGPTAEPYKNYPGKAADPGATDNDDAQQDHGSSQSSATSPGAILAYVLMVIVAAVPLVGQVLGFF